MSARLHHRESPTARRFSQVCIVSLAALITSSIGLLAYGVADPAPAWLGHLVTASSVMVGVSFLGWVVASLTQLLRDRVNPR